MPSAIKAIRSIVFFLSVVWIVSTPVVAQTKVTAGTVGTASANVWPLLIAIDKGLFKTEGIDLELLYIQSSAQVIQQLAAGSLDFVVGTGLVDPVRAVEKGAGIALVSIDVQSPPYALVGKPAIKTIRDLAGKTISIGGAKDITRIFLERMLEPNGIKAGQYDTVYAGATSARTQALLAGAVDAAIVLPPFNFQLASAGYSELGLTADYAPELPFSGSSVNIAWAKANPAGPGKLMAALSKAVDWYNDEKNRAEAIAVLVRASKLNADEVEKSYDFFRKGRFFQGAGKVSRKRLSALISTLQALGDIGSIELERLVLNGGNQFVD